MGHSKIMYKHLIIVGSGGHGQAVADLALSSGDFKKISFVDDSYLDNTKALGLNILGNSDSLFAGVLDFDACIVAIGNNKVREKLVNKIIQHNLPLVSLVHSRAWVSDFTLIGLGVVVMAGAVVGTNTKLAVGSLVNANATIDHDCVLESFAHVGVGVQLAGGVEIGHSAWIQVGSCAECFVKVDSGSVIKPGSKLLTIEVDLV